jgi:hypothetical protein
LTTVQRCGQDLPETVIDVDGSNCPRLSGTCEDEDINRVVEAIVTFLGTQTEPVPEKPTIREEVEGRTKLVTAALRVAVAAGKVERMGGGRKGDPYLYTLPSGISGFRVPIPKVEPENTLACGPNAVRALRVGEAI